MARILVVDDEEDIRLLLREVLEDAGYEVVEAGNGDEALRRYWATPTDLVITDIVLPGKGGMEIIRELRRQTPEVPIIVMSGCDRLTTLDWFATDEPLRVQRVFQKPFRLLELCEAVREGCPHKHPS